MSSISMMEARMPPGFRFHPRDEELVLDYLLHKLSGRSHSSAAMIDVDLNKCEPWDLPEAACVGGKEWYFFNLRDRKYATGQRTNRATVSGYWKATGKDRAVVSGDAAVVGMRKTLVFYRGRAPKASKTEWVMHEFRLEPPAALGRDGHQRLKEDWVLCRVFYKSRTTTPKLPSEDAQDGTPSIEPEPPAALPLTSLADAYTTFGAAPTVTEQVFCFGLPALPFKRPVNLSDLLVFDTSEKVSIGIVMRSSMSSNNSSVLELPPNCNWNQENVLSKMWNPLGI
ncbi:unnamed protein product [Urochloa humidicola]